MTPLVESGGQEKIVNCDSSLVALLDAFPSSRRL